MASSTLFIVDQRQFAVVYALGEIREVVTEPGLEVQAAAAVPERGLHVDRRVQTLDSPVFPPVFTAEKKSLVIDWMVKWAHSPMRKQFIRNSGASLAAVGEPLERPSSRRP